MEAGTVNVKNLVTGSQQAFPASDVAGILAFLGYFCNGKQTM
jgi:hypothetical protein